MADISKIKLPDGTVYDIKDSEAQSKISDIETTIGDINSVLEEVL